jgi:hypothetical protein
MRTAGLVRVDLDGNGIRDRANNPPALIEVVHRTARLLAVKCARVALFHHRRTNVNIARELCNTWTALNAASSRWEPRLGGGDLGRGDRGVRLDQGNQESHSMIRCWSSRWAPSGGRAVTVKRQQDHHLSAPIPTLGR